MEWEGQASVRVNDPLIRQRPVNPEKLLAQSPIGNDRKCVVHLFHIHGCVCVVIVDAKGEHPRLL